MAQPNQVITAHAGSRVDRAHFQADELDPRFRAGDEERPGQDKVIEAEEIEVAAIHHIEGPSLQNQFVQNANIGHFPVGNRDKRGDRALQIQKGVQFDGSLGFGGIVPRETGSSTGQSSWNPEHKPSGPTPIPSARLGKGREHGG